MPPTRRTYACFAHKLGAVSRDDLRRARDLAADGGSLEERLLAIGALCPDVARFVRAAWERDLATCARCGRRTDVDAGASPARVGERRERGCVCPRPAEPLAAPGAERSAS